MHDMEACVYSNHPREAAASTCLAIIFGWNPSGVPWFLRSTAVLMQALPVQSQNSVGTSVGRGSFETTYIICLTWDEWSCNP